MDNVELVAVAHVWGVAYRLGAFERDHLDSLCRVCRAAAVDSVDEKA